MYRTYFSFSSSSSILVSLQAWYIAHTVKVVNWCPRDTQKRAAILHYWFNCMFFFRLASKRIFYFTPLYSLSFWNRSSNRGSNKAIAFYFNQTPSAVDKRVELVVSERSQKCFRSDCTSSMWAILHGRVVLRACRKHNGMLPSSTWEKIASWIYKGRHNRNISKKAFSKTAVKTSDITQYTLIRLRTPQPDTLLLKSERIQ